MLAVLQDRPGLLVDTAMVPTCLNPNAGRIMPSGCCVRLYVPSISTSPQSNTQLEEQKPQRFHKCEAAPCRDRAKALLVPGRMQPTQRFVRGHDLP